MTRGPSRPRGFGTLGIQASQTLGGRGVGGGVQDSVRRILTRSQQVPRPAASSVGLPIGTVVSRLAQPSVNVILPAVGVLPAGLWVVSADYQGLTDGMSDAFAQIILRNDDAVAIPGGTGPRSNFPTGTVAITASHSAFYRSFGDHQLVADVERSGSGLSAESTSITATLWAHLT